MLASLNCNTCLQLLYPLLRLTEMSERPTVGSHCPDSFLCNSVLVANCDAPRRVLERFLVLASQVMNDTGEEICEREAARVRTVCTELERCISRSQRCVRLPDQPERSGSLAMQEYARIHSVHRVINRAKVAVVKRRSFFAVLVGPLQ